MTALPVRLPLPELWERRLDAVHFAFQPIVRADDLRVDGVEALLRGVDKAGFRAIPDLFDQAHADGVLHIFDVALRHKLLWKSAPLLRRYQKRLFYNLDTRCVVDVDEQAECTAKLLAAVGLDAHQVCLEISEQHQLIPARHVAATLELYRSQGYSVALDDYGVGYGQLRSLFLTSPDVLKIDRFFIAQVDRDPKRRLFLRRLCEFGSELGATVVAEGVETREELDVCREVGADLLQGFGILRPQLSLEYAITWAPFRPKRDDVQYQAVAP